MLVVMAHLPVVASLHANCPAPIRRRLRLALLAGLVAWLPAVALGWAPIMAALLDHGYAGSLPPSAGAISLLALAITYPAIVTRGDLFVLEAAVRRLAASAIAAVLLLAAALGVLHVVDLAAGPQGDDRLAIAVLLFALTVPAFDPLWRGIQRVVERRLNSLEPAYAHSLEAIGDRLLQALDEAGIARVLTGSVPALLGLASVDLWLRASDGRWLYFSSGAAAHQAMPPHDTDAIPALPETGTASARLPEPLLPLIEADQPFVPPPAIAAADAAMCVPVRLGDEPRALLLLGHRRSQDPYRQPEREALLLLSRQVAAALLFVDQLAELRSRNAELAQLTSRLARAREEERKHLSHELHDDVAQDLVALTRQLRRHQPGAVSDAIWQDMIAQAQEALTATRRICNDLRPAILDMGLTSALRELVDRASSDLPSSPIQLEIRGAELRLDEEREFALYRMSQEALTNVLKHACATEVVIAVRFSSNTAEVEVTDNGRGFAVPERLEDIGGDHLGLLGMRERLAALGGQMRVESHPGRGTSVWARMPAGA
jgi:signal transduction histidine kinase